MAAAFNISIPAVPAGVDWRLYSWVVRARIRRRVLLGLAQMENQRPEPRTASSVRKFINADDAVGLNPVLRAVRELARKKLITCAGVTKLRSCKLYRLTPAGLGVVRQMQQ